MRSRLPEFIRAQVLVVCAAKDYVLGLGDYSIGSDSECDIVLRDVQTAPRHAGLSVRRDAVAVRRLSHRYSLRVGSQRVAGERSLRDGDRLIIGNQQLNVFAWAPYPRSETPVPGPTRAASLDPTGATGSTPLRVLGRLADRMLALGRTAQAEELLREELAILLEGVRAGSRIDDDTIQLASISALKLAGAARRGFWVSYVLELHSLLRCPLSPQAISLLDGVVRRVDWMDWLQVECLKERLSSCPKPDLDRESCIRALDALLRQRVSQR